MARRIINRREKREEFDAAERRTKETTEETAAETEEEADDEEEDEDEEGEEEGEADESAEAPDADAEEGDDEDAPPKRKKKPVKEPKVKVVKPKRTRASKVVRLKVVWGVFNNSNQRVATFDYPKRKDADELATKLTGDKKNTHFVQPVKEPIE